VYFLALASRGRDAGVDEAQFSTRYVYESTSRQGGVSVHL